MPFTRRIERLAEVLDEVTVALRIGMPLRAHGPALWLGEMNLPLLRVERPDPVQRRLPSGIPHYDGFRQIRPRLQVLPVESEPLFVDRDIPQGASSGLGVRIQRTADAEETRVRFLRRIARWPLTKRFLKYSRPSFTAGTVVTRSFPSCRQPVIGIPPLMTGFSPGAAT